MGIKYIKSLFLFLLTLYSCEIITKPEKVVDYSLEGNSVIDSVFCGDVNFIDLFQTKGETTVLKVHEIFLEIPPIEEIRQEYNEFVRLYISDVNEARSFIISFQLHEYCYVKTVKTILQEYHDSFENSDRSFSYQVKKTPVHDLEIVDKLIKIGMSFNDYVPVDEREPENKYKRHGMSDNSYFSHLVQMQIISGGVYSQKICSNIEMTEEDFNFIMRLIDVKNEE
jgi:hypothetical protein